LRKTRNCSRQACRNKIGFGVSASVPENKFNLVTAVETQYYWPDLLKNLQEILRVLKPGGTLIVIAESYEKGAHAKPQRPVMKLLRSTNLGVDEHRALFSTAGYTDVQIFEERSKVGFVGSVRSRCPADGQPWKK